MALRSRYFNFGAGAVKVLIVDDDIIARRHLAHIFDTLNINYDLYADAAQAWRAIVAGEHYPIILSDWLMPEMDGIELLKKVRSMDLKYRPQFILLTALTDTEYLVKGLNAGADDFIRKPIIAEELHARLQAAMRLSRLQLTLKHHNIALSDALTHLEKDLDSAAKLLASLMPKYNINDDIEFSSLCKPCQFLGGDLYGYRALTKRQTAFYQIDVSGHGVPAALFSSMINHDLVRGHGEQELLLQELADGEIIINAPVSVVAELNRRYLAELASDIYFTMNYALIDSACGRVRLCQAGHPSPICYRQQTASTELIGDGGFAVALVAEAVYEERVVQLSAGDRLFLYSDGIIEAENSATRVRYGVERLQAEIKRHGACDITTIINKVYESVCQWRGHDQLDDDVTILALQWNG